MKLTGFLAMDVVDRGGEHLGRVVELRCAGKPEHGDSRDARIVTELIYGKAGWLERLGFKAVEERRVSWASLSRVERSLLTIRAGEMGRLKSRHQIDGPLKIHS